MKKKIYSGLAFMAMLAAPPTLSSCSEDDVNTVLEILDLILSTNDLNGTAWITADSTQAIEFTSTTQGNYYNQSSDPIPFTYTLDTENNILTLNFSDGTQQYTIVAFTKGEKLVLKNSKGNQITFQPFTGE